MAIRKRTNSRVTRSDSGTITTALVYTRVSTEEQSREGLSLEAQLAECRRYAAQHGWVLGHEYQDVLSGTRDDRPQYQALLATVRRLRADGQQVVVLVMRLDRFGRKVLERVRCREELKALGVATHSVREGGEVSDLVANILASVAEEEVRQLGERISAVRQHVMATGWYPGGRVPWGYRTRPATDEERRRGAPKSVLIEDEETAPYVREALARVARGTSVRRLHQWIRSLPAAARGGRALTYYRVQVALRSPVYVGRLYDGDPDVLARPRGHWPALVDDDTWQRAQTRLGGHKRMPLQASGGYLLTGLLRCPQCGLRVQGARRIDRPHKYRCAAHVTGATAPDFSCDFHAVMHRVDAAVLAKVAPLVSIATATEPGLQTALRRAWQALQEPQDDTAVEAQHRRASLERQAEQAKRRLTNAAVIFADGDIDKEGYELLRDKARADLDAATTELQNMDETVAVSAPLLPFDVVIQAAPEWDVILGDSDVTAQRGVLALLIERVIPQRVGHGKYEVDITWTPQGEALSRLAKSAEGNGQAA